MNHIFNELIGNPPPCKDCPTEAINHCEETGHECKEFRIYCNSGGHEPGAAQTKADNQAAVEFANLPRYEQEKIVKTISKLGTVRYCSLCGTAFVSSKETDQCVLCNSELLRINKTREFVCIDCGQIFETRATKAKRCPVCRPIENRRLRDANKHRYYKPIFLRKVAV